MQKNKTTNLTLPLTLLFVFSSLLTAQSALAQAAIGIAAIPPRLEITVKPGEVITKEIKVRNESKTERFMSTDVRDFIVTNDKGTPVQVESDKNNDNRWAASGWIQISPSQFKLKGGETKSLVVTVMVPADAVPGGHYAMILHSPKTETILNDSGSTIETNVGTLAYVTVPGDIKQDAKVKSFVGPSFAEYGPIDFKAIIENLSDIHIKPTGAVTVTNMIGGKTAELALTETNIFPYTTREFTNQLDKKWLFGRYKAQINAAYGTAGGIVTATLFFWVIPWRFLLLSATSIALIVAIIILIKKKGKDQDETNETKIDELENELEELKKKYKDK